MRIRFTVSGGFAGVVKECVIDTTAMPPSERIRIEELVEPALQLPPGEFLSRTGRDLEQYQIAVDNGDVQVCFIYDSATVVAPARRLVAYLKKCARPR
ncbi:MAG: protealysin inhibitor emfourin [Vicinamibacterales bacterium]